MKIRVKYTSEDVKRLEKIEKGDWVDLSTREDVWLMPGQSTLIPLGVCIELPKGYEAIVAPRSSTFKKYGITMTNSIGVIDETYCGDGDEWHFPALAHIETNIPKGTRICQFRIIEHQPEIEFEEVEVLGNENRNGFGSTGER